MSSDKSGKIYD